MITYLQYEKVLEKNSLIKEKWCKQISDLRMKIENDEKIAGDSDSEAEFQLIPLSVPQIEERNEKSIFDPSSDLTNLLKKSENKDKFLQRNLIPKTPVDRMYNRYQRNVTSLDSTVQKQPIARKSGKENRMTVQHANHGFLSIVKIKTNDQNSLFNEKKVEYKS